MSLEVDADLVFRTCLKIVVEEICVSLCGCHVLWFSGIIPLNRGIHTSITFKLVLNYLCFLILALSGMNDGVYSHKLGRGMYN